MSTIRMDHAAAAPSSDRSPSVPAIACAAAPMRLDVVVLGYGDAGRTLVDLVRAHRRQYRLAGVHTDAETHAAPAGGGALFTNDLDAISRLRADILVAACDDPACARAIRCALDRGVDVVAFRQAFDPRLAKTAQARTGAVFRACDPADGAAALFGELEILRLHRTMG